MGGGRRERGEDGGERGWSVGGGGGGRMGVGRGRGVEGETESRPL